MIVQTGPIAATSRPSACRRVQPPLDGLGHGDRLRHGEGDGRVDADAAVGGLLHRRDPGSVAGIFTMMLGASASNSTAWSARACASR